MKQIFFKTVRNDYTSVWAIGKYSRRYEIGKRYTFDPELPAHVFGLNSCGEYFTPYSGSKFIEQNIDHQQVYEQRAENSGSRVLICYGEVKLKQIPVCDIGQDWDFSDEWNTSPKWRFTSSDFVVVGEIDPPDGRVQDTLEEKRDGWVVKRDFKYTAPAPTTVEAPVVETAPPDGAVALAGQFLTMNTPNSAYFTDPAPPRVQRVLRDRSGRFTSKAYTSVKLVYTVPVSRDKNGRFAKR